MKIFKNSLWYLMAFLCAVPLQGQQILKVATQKIEKQFDYEKGQSVIIQGEKAEINITTSQYNLVRIQLDIISKHPDIDIAKHDISNMQYRIVNEIDKILIRNFNTKPNQTKAEVTVLYNITVPKDCPVTMTNYFGTSNLTNLAQSVDIQSEFSPVTMSNINGQVSVNSRFGDILGEWLKGDISIQSHRSNVTLKNIEGTFDIRAKFGVLKIFADQKLIDLSIEAEKGDVYFFNPEPSRFGYELTAHYGNITSPQDLKLNFTEDTEMKRHAVFSPGMIHPNVSVRITYGDIVIRNSRP